MAQAYHLTGHRVLIARANPADRIPFKANAPIVIFAQDARVQIGLSDHNSNCDCAHLWLRTWINMRTARRYDQGHSTDGCYSQEPTAG